jgi:hypothetical protein
MRYTLEGATDAGSMLLFDPEAVPDDFIWKKSPEQLESLMRQGRLCWINPSADGDYELGVFLEEAIPEDLLPYAKLIETIDELQVPSGRLFFTGIELAFHSNASALRKYPHMGQSMDVPAGRYRIGLFEFDYPEEFYEDLFRRGLPERQFRLYRAVDSLAPIGCISFLVLLGTIRFLSWKVWAVTVMPIALLLIALPILLSRTPGYRAARSTCREIERDHPGYGVVLGKLSGHPTDLL